MSEVALKRVCSLVTDPGPEEERASVALEHIIGGTGKIGSDVELPRRRPAAGLAEVQPGDVLFGKLRPYLAKTLLVHEPMFASTELLALRPKSDTDARWLHYFVMSDRVVRWAVATSDGSKMPRTSWSVLGELRTTVPDPRSQRAIADFLDAETARIDALIEKKRRLVSLLQDRWIEYVREAITQGSQFSDPLSVTQKEIDWDTARAIKLSRFSFFGSGTTPPSADESMYGGEIPWVLTGDLEDSRLHKTSRTVTQKALREIGPLVVHPSGSLVIAMYGATIGKSAIIDIPACVNQACSVLTSRGKNKVEFVFYWLLAHRQQLIERGYGAGQPNISQELLKAIRIALPPIEVQDAIIHRLSQSREMISDATRKLGQQIELLTEHRQALITATVTGQVEVAVSQ